MQKHYHFLLKNGEESSLHFRSKKYEHTCLCIRKLKESLTNDFVKLTLL